MVVRPSHLAMVSGVHANRIGRHFKGGGIGESNLRRFAVATGLNREQVLAGLEQRRALEAKRMRLDELFAQKGLVTRQELEVWIHEL
ncbi:MAG: hypothetical protein HC818_05945 [Synechococcaceae cyanobacterium RM1_1_27]|nr:hypothetical protein [Synechococcaceae cyanobacterium RM1_1_27]